jgi:CheY-like chemotaxis protein
MVASNLIPEGTGFCNLEVTSVLILDDGLSLSRETQALSEVPDFLVTEARSAVEAVREVMSTDFDVIVCNMEMPQMPVEMFYRAIQRVKPQLCRRLIFIAPSALSAAMERFIQEVEGLVVFKPVEISDLSRMVTLATARRPASVI